MWGYYKKKNVKGFVAMVCLHVNCMIDNEVLD